MPILAVVAARPRARMRLPEIARQDEEIAKWESAWRALPKGLARDSPALSTLPPVGGSGPVLAMRLDLLNLVLVLAAAWGGGRLAQRLALPAVLGEIGAGLLLGPPVLGLLQTGPALEILAEVGVLLMMLFIGMETDPKDLRRASWAGLSIAVGGFLLPFVGAALVVTAFGAPPLAAAFVGVAAGVTSLATKARVLVDLGLTRTRLAHVMMSGAVWTDVASLLFFTALLGAFRASGAAGSVELAGLLDLGARALLFFAGAGLLGGVMLPRLGRWLVAEGRANRTASITLVLVFAIGLAQLAELAGLHGIIGAFVAGLFLRHDLLGRQLAADLRQVVHDAALGFMVPIFFVTVAFDLRPAVLLDDAGLVVALVAVASVGKVVGTALAYLPTGRGWREALVVGAGMNDRGAVEIIMAGVALQEGLIDVRLFGVLVVLAVATTATVPVLLRMGVAWLERHHTDLGVDDGRVGLILVSADAGAIRVAEGLRGQQPICLVDSSAEHCARARELGFEVVQGDALDEMVLQAAGAQEAAALVAMTPNPGLNALVAQVARRAFCVPEVYVKTAEDGADEAVLRHLGARGFHADRGLSFPRPRSTPGAA